MSPTTRRSFLRGSLSALAPLSLLASPVAWEARAKKNSGRKPTSIAQRVTAEKLRCTEGGGAFSVSNQPGSATSFCSGGARDGRECTHTKKSTVCTQSAGPAGPETDDPHAPPLAGTEQLPPPDLPTANPGALPDVPLEGIIRASASNTRRRKQAHRHGRAPRRKA